MNQQKHKHFSIFSILIAAVIFLGFVGLLWQHNILSKTEQSSGALATPADSSGEVAFRVTFLDVGEADAALIQCDGRYMLIDGGNVADSNTIYAFLKAHQVNHLDVMMATHPHEDHVGGLAGALNYATVDSVYCSVTEYDTTAFQNFRKYCEKQNLQITVPKVGDRFSLGTAEVTVLGPVKQAAEDNNNSIMLRIVYGDTSFLFTGDGENPEEQDILVSGAPLESTVLKVSHHGSDDATGYLWLRSVHPRYGVISVGTNDYGHPTEKVLSRLHDAGVQVYRTDLHGTITCESDGKHVTFITEKNGEESVQEQSGHVSGAAGNTVASTVTGSGNAEADCTYILNANSQRFHKPDCSSVAKMSEKNKIYFTGTREEAMEMDYQPCGICKP